MKKYIVTISIRVQAENEEEAKRIFKEVVESGRAMGSEGTKIAQIKLSADPIVKEEQS